MKQPGLAGNPLNQVELSSKGKIFENLEPDPLIEQALLRGEGRLVSSGALLVSTGKHTGRAARDKYFVCRGDGWEDQIAWSELNKPISAEVFDRLYHKMLAYFSNRDVFLQQRVVGAHPDFHFPVQVITDTAWQSLSIRNLFRSPQEFVDSRQPGYTIYSAIGCLADPALDGTRSDTFICIDFAQKLILIGGSGYAGEIKKAMFTALHLEYPLQGILSMHCSANIGPNGDTALFFGLSGTGKTTLSSTPERCLIGDDEHAWCNSGVFNLEGGCYAKTLNLNASDEPIIWAAVNQRGTVIENALTYPESDEIDFRDDSITENTRASYPIDRIPNFVRGGKGNHPSNIFFLSADAFGVLPPISRLLPQQIEHYFLSGYTAKLAGTEDGLGKEPKTTFSACFALPFLPLKPKVYAQMLLEKVSRHNSAVWLVNTGWIGGSYGVGSRIPLAYTRRMISAALTGELSNEAFSTESYFGLSIPQRVNGIPADILRPSTLWASLDAYKEHAKQLKEAFQANLQQYV